MHVFDAATLDVNLAGISSYAAADALAARGVPFVFTTGYGTHFLSDGYRERPILTKPFAYEDLGQIVALHVKPDKLPELKRETFTA